MKQRQDYFWVVAFVPLGLFVFGAFIYNNLDLRTPENNYHQLIIKSLNAPKPKIFGMESPIKKLEILSFDKPIIRNDGNKINPSIGINVHYREQNYDLVWTKCEQNFIFRNGELIGKDNAWNEQ